MSSGLGCSWFVTSWFPEGQNVRQIRSKEHQQQKKLALDSEIGSCLSAPKE